MITEDLLLTVWIADELADYLWRSPQFNASNWMQPQ